MFEIFARTFNTATRSEFMSRPKWDAPGHWLRPEPSKMDLRRIRRGDWDRKD